MAIDTTVLATDLAGMIADLPITAKFGSTEFTCAATELTSEETLLLCGNLDTRAVRVVFSTAAFTVTASFKPQGFISLKYPSASAWTSYEIVSISLAPDLVSYEVVLKDDNRA